MHSQKNSARGFRAFWIVLLVWHLASCSSLTSDVLATVVEEPTVSVDSLSIGHANITTVEILLALQVHNPNNFALPISEYRFDVAFNERPFLSSQSRKGFTIAANTSSQVIVPITVTLLEALKLVKDAHKHDQLNYRIDSEFLVDHNLVKNITVRARKEGSITLPKLPRFWISDIDIEGLSFNQADFLLELSITNLNDFEIDIEDVQYELIVTGESWVSGHTKTHLSIPANAKALLKIPVQVKFANMRGSVIDVLRLRDLTQFKVQGSFTLSSSLPVLKNLVVPIRFSPTP